MNLPENHTLPKAPLVSEHLLRKASFWHTFNAVLWSFFGVRRSDRHIEDMETLNPVHVVVVGILAAALFVVILILIVKSVVPPGV